MFVSLVKPDNVTLERNTTENNGCNDLWVNFTCNSSEANPPVHNYALIKNKNEFIFSRKGTWIEKISRGETFVYKCQAYQQFDNVTSTNDITLNVNGKFVICLKQLGIIFLMHYMANLSETLFLFLILN